MCDADGDGTPTRPVQGPVLLQPRHHQHLHTLLRRGPAHLLWNWPGQLLRYHDDDDDDDDNDGGGGGDDDDDDDDNNDDDDGDDDDGDTTTRLMMTKLIMWL